MYDYVCKTTPMYEIKTRLHMNPISWVAAMPVLSQFRLPGHSEITVIKTDQEEAQAYWEIIGFGKNIFSSKDDDKIRPGAFCEWEKDNTGKLMAQVAVAFSGTS